MFQWSVTVLFLNQLFYILLSRREGDGHRQLSRRREWHHHPVSCPQQRGRNGWLSPHRQPRVCSNITSKERLLCFWQFQVELLIVIFSLVLFLNIVFCFLLYGQTNTQYAIFYNKNIRKTTSLNNHVWTLTLEFKIKFSCLVYFLMVPFKDLCVACNC